MSATLEIYRHLFPFTKRECSCVCISSVFLSSVSDATYVFHSLVAACGNASVCRCSSDNFPWLSFFLPLVHCARETCLSNLAVREFANFLLLLLVKSTRSLFFFILQLILFSVWRETLRWIVYECGFLLAVYGISKRRCHLLAVCMPLYAVLF